MFLGRSSQSPPVAVKQLNKLGELSHRLKFVL